MWHFHLTLAFFQVADSADRLIMILNPFLTFCSDRNGQGIHSAVLPMTSGGGSLFLCRLHFFLRTKGLEVQTLPGVTTWIKNKDKANLLRWQQERKKELESLLAQALNCLWNSGCMGKINKTLLPPPPDGFCCLQQNMFTLKWLWVFFIREYHSVIIPLLMVTDLFTFNKRWDDVQKTVNITGMTVILWETGP